MLPASIALFFVVIYCITKKITFCIIYEDTTTAKPKTPKDIAPEFPLPGAAPSQDL